MYKKIGIISLFTTVLWILSACQYEQLNRSEYMSESAGNATAHNSALQIIDPWPLSAGNNNLKVPATKYGVQPDADNAASPDGAMTSIKKKN